MKRMENFKRNKFTTLTAANNRDKIFVHNLQMDLKQFSLFHYILLLYFLILILLTPKCLNLFFSVLFSSKNICYNIKFFYIKYF